MNFHLTSMERHLARCLPCTTAAVAAWYSRIWRTPEQRVQTLVWAVLVVAAVGILVWLAPPASPSSVRWAVPDGARVWLGVLGIITGIRAGYSARRRISVWFDRHWLAWCLYPRQRRNETIVCGLWRAGAATLQWLLLWVLARHWVALFAYDLMLLTGLFFGGFVLAFTVSHRFCGHPAIATPILRASASIHRLPAIVCMQTARPWGWLIGAGVVAVIVSAIAGYAVQYRTPHLLTAAAVMAVGGCVFSQIRLNPGTAALYGLLAWTGVSLWWSLLRILVMPVSLVLLLMLPIAVAALLLERPPWALLAGLGVLAAVWAVLVRALGDLAQMRRGRGEAFVLIHNLIPLALLMSLGPEESITLIGLHLGWLLWRAQRLWNDGRERRSI